MAAFNDFSGRERLKAHSREFDRRVKKVADHVYVAVGYSASNVILIQGEGGSIVVDTSANPADAMAILNAFGNRLVRPVKALIYTHNHPDHTGGASVFADGDHPLIFSHRLLVTLPPESGRGRRGGGDAFGTALPDREFINAGTQLEYGRSHPHTREGFLPPSETFDGDEDERVIAAVTMRFIHTPGEADENISVWLPKQRVLVTGDVFLKTFPNIAPLRGLPTRPVEKWIASLERLIALDPDVVVPGHMGAILQPHEARNALIAYRDGIKFVYDATMDGLSKGATVDELVQAVKLPPALAVHPYLQEFYGTVEWAVRGIYHQKAGWFDGNPTHIFPLTERQRAGKLVLLAGGRENMLESARRALGAGEFQWAAEQADYLLALDERDTCAMEIKISALREMGERQLNATARNYYLTAANDLEAGLGEDASNIRR